MTSTTFMYFAYGSNLLAKRLHINNPTAVVRGIGKLKDYKLDFNGKSSVWNGASATIVEKHGSNVWGAIWEIDKSNLENLDSQEGVLQNIYKVVIKDIETPNGENISCRLYQQVGDLSNGLEERKPSKTYLDIIVKGAEEVNLPENYIEFLKAFTHNDQLASDDIRLKTGF